jgi:hypothetical protein
MATPSAFSRISTARHFRNGEPRIASERERKLWLDGWNDGYRTGTINGRRLERNTRKRSKRPRAKAESSK